MTLSLDLGMTVGERARASAPAWAEWAETASYTVGAEEEVMLLEPGRDWALAPRLEEVMSVLSPEMAEQVTRETQDAVLELATRPHVSAEATGAEAARLRARLTAERGPAAALPGVSRSDLPVVGYPSPAALRRRRDPHHGRSE